jgi:hypothetical protein
LLEGRIGLGTLWYLSVGSVAVQALVSLALVWRELGRRLGDARVPGAAQAV